MKWYLAINGTVCGKAHNFLTDALDAMNATIAALPAGYNNEVAVLDDNGSYWASNKSMRGRA